MAKQTWKPGNMIYPIPAVMVSVTDGKGQDDIITVAWTGTICTNPPFGETTATISRLTEPASTTPLLWSVWLPPISVRPGAE